MTSRDDDWKIDTPCDYPGCTNSFQAAIRGIKACKEHFEWFEEKVAKAIEEEIAEAQWENDLDTPPFVAKNVP